MSEHRPSASRRPSLRRQLAWTFSALALAVAIAQAALVWFTGHQAEEAMIDSIAGEQLRQSIAQYSRDPALAQPNTPDMRLYVAAGGDLSGLPPFLRHLPQAAGRHELHPEADLEYHVAVGHDDGRWFYLVYDVADHERRQRNVIAVLAISVAVIALGVLAASDRLARRLTGDLERLSLAVRGETTAGQGGKLAELARHAESADLASALDDQRHRLDAALARERAFSAAASHELRTPLMRASSTLELLRGTDLDEHQRTKLDQLGAGLTEITMLTAGLLRVARGGARGAGSVIALPELVGEVVAHLESEARARSIAIATRVPSAATGVGDRDALWIVLTNLLRNAIRHSGGARVSVDWLDGVLGVSDDGRGFDAGQGPGSRLRGTDGEGGNGLGLGLSIVERICEAAGWRITIDSDPARGTRVAIAIPQRPTERESAP
ncbi:MAG: sensor histidine kinase [Burkholderiales bacterium]|nr:MAG: sensor histidine kinase [Burkholderiales bacterium]